MAMAEAKNPNGRSRKRMMAEAAPVTVEEVANTPVMGAVVPMPEGMPEGTPEGAEISAEREFQRHQRIERLEASGDQTPWIIDLIGKNETVYLHSADGKRHAIMSAGELKAERETQEIALRLEKSWEPLLDVMAEGDEKLKTYLQENKGCVLEYTAMVMQTEPMIAPDAARKAAARAKRGGELEVNFQALAEGINDAAYSYIEHESHTEEDEVMREKTKAALLLQSKRDMDLKAQADIAREFLDEPTMVNALLHGEITEAKKPERTASQLRADLDRDRSTILALLKSERGETWSSSGFKTLEEDFLQGMNELRIAEGEQMVNDWRELPEDWVKFFQTLTVRRVMKAGEELMEKAPKTTSADHAKLLSETQADVTADVSQEDTEAQPESEKTDVGEKVPEPMKPRRRVPTLAPIEPTNSNVGDNREPEAEEEKTEPIRYFPAPPTPASEQAPEELETTELITKEERDRSLKKAEERSGLDIVQKRARKVRARRKAEQALQEAPLPVPVTAENREATPPEGMKSPLYAEAQRVQPDTNRPVPAPARVQSPTSPRSGKGFSEAITSGAYKPKGVMERLGEWWSSLFG